MTKKWKYKRHPKPSEAPIRGKSRQMWKAQFKNMIDREEDVPCDGAVSAAGAGGNSTARAA